MKPCVERFCSGRRDKNRNDGLCRVCGRIKDGDRKPVAPRPIPRRFKRYGS